MKHLYKECRNVKEVNRYLKSIGLEEFSFDVDYDFLEEFDFDSDQHDLDRDGTGVSVKVTTEYEVFVTKYTQKDIDELNAELLAD